MKDYLYKITYIIFFILLIIYSGCSRKDELAFEKQGDMAFMHGDFHKAVKFWKKAVKEQPFNSILHSKTGNAFLKLSMIDKAEDCFKQSVKINPGNLKAQKKLIRILLIQGDNAGALEKMNKLKTLFDKDLDYYILRGDFFMIADDLHSAEQQYNTAVNLQENNTRARLKLALCLMALKKDKYAESIAANVAVKEVTDPFNLLLLSDYYILSNRLDLAEMTIKTAVKAYPDSRMLTVRLVQFYLQAMMKEKALKTLEILEKKYPDTVRFKLMIADFYLSEMNLACAEKILNQSKSLLNESSRTSYNLLMGKYFLYTHQIPYAISFFKTAVKARPLLFSAQYLLGIAYFAGDQARLAEKSFVNALMLNTEHVDTMIILAYLHYKNREYNLAGKYIEKVLAIEKTNSRALMAKALCLLDQNEFKDASATFFNAFSISKDLSALYFYGIALEKRGDIDRAVRIFEKIIEINPNLVDVLQHYSSLLIKLGMYKKAVLLAENILKQERINPLKMHVAGNIYFMLNQYNKSIEIFKRSLKDENTGQNSYTRLAAAYCKVGKSDLAMDTLNKCIKKYPLYDQAWIDIAAIYLEQNKIQKALDTMQTACKKVLNSQSVTGNLAWLLLKTGTNELKALELARKAYEINPENAAVVDTLGLAYYRKKAYSQAEWMFEKAEKLAPEKGIVKYHKAMLLYKIQKISSARKYLKLALEYDLEPSTIAEVQKMLVELK